MYPSSADTHQAVEDGVGLRPQNGCYIDTHDGLVSAKNPRGTGEAALELRWGIPLVGSVGNPFKVAVAIGCLHRRIFG